jgi:hypothetical protein
MRLDELKPSIGSRKKRKRGWEVPMERRPAGAPKARGPGPEEGQRLVLREGRCPSNDAFPNGGFIIHLGKNLPSSMWKI